MAERERAARVVARLNAEMEGHVHLEAVRWEESYYTATADFQAQIPRASEADLVLCILWRRLGSELPPDRYHRADGSPYGSGTEYEFEDAQSRAAAEGTPDLLVYRKMAPAEFRTDDPRAYEVDHAQYMAFQAFWMRWFRSEAGHFTAGYQNFKTTDEFEALVEKQLRQWLKRREQAVWPESKGSPFRGLEPFNARYASVFFGRRRAVEKARAQLIAAEQRGTPFLLLIGASGTGKSSLARAGLLPRLTETGGVPGIEAWRTLVLRPQQLGADPIAGLATELHRAVPELAEGSYRTAAPLAVLLRKMPEGAATPLRAALDRFAAAEQQRMQSDRAPQARLLLVLDQLEELFSLPDDGQKALVLVLDALVRERAAWVIATLRSDFYPAFQRVPELMRLKETGAQFDVLEPGSAEIREIIQGPARAADLSFEATENGQGIDEILERAACAPGALPLLQFTLDALYAVRDTQHNRLTAAAYAALGGIEGAISRVAEDAFTALERMPEAQAALPHLLWTLVDHPDGETQRPVLRAASRALLEAHLGMPALIAALLEKRLLVANDEGQGAVIRLAHEALTLEWPRARSLIAADRDLSRIRRRVEGDATEWERNNRAADYLLPLGRLLAGAIDLLAQRRDTLSPPVIDFIDASADAEARRQAAERERELAHERERELAHERERTQAAQRLARRTRYAAAALALLALATGFFLWGAEQQREKAEQQQKLAERQRQVAEEQKRRADASLEAAAKGLIIAEDTAKFDPSDANKQHDVSVFYSVVGDVLVAQGNLVGALKSYQDSLAIREKLAQSDRGNAGWQHDLSVAYEKVGDVEKAQGHLAGALKSYRESLAVREMLLKSSPENEDWRRDLSVSYERVGDVLSAGDVVVRAEALTRLLDEYRRSQPDTSFRTPDPPLSLEMQMAELENLEDALKSYCESLAIRQKLVQSGPLDTQRQQDLAVSYDKIGGVREAQFRQVGILLIMDGTKREQIPAFVEALDSYRDSLAIREKLALSDPNNAGWWRDYYVSLTHVAGLSEPAEAAPLYGRARAIAQELAQLDPSNPQAKADLDWITRKCQELPASGVACTAP